MSDDQQPTQAHPRLLSLANELILCIFEDSNDNEVIRKHPDETTPNDYQDAIPLSKAYPQLQDVLRELSTSTHVASYFQLRRREEQGQPPCLKRVSIQIDAGSLSNNHEALFDRIRRCFPRLDVLRLSSAVIAEVATHQAQKETEARPRIARLVEEMKPLVQQMAQQPWRRCQGQRRWQMVVFYPEPEDYGFPPPPEFIDFLNAEIARHLQGLLGNGE